MHSFSWIFLWFIYQNVSNNLELWNNTHSYKILHTLNLGCSFITLVEPCNNQQPRCDITWLHVTNHLYHGFPELNNLTLWFRVWLFNPLTQKTMVHLRLFRLNFFKTFNPENRGIITYMITIKGWSISLKHLNFLPS
jgi:hypothetical protein